MGNQDDLRLTLSIQFIRVETIRVAGLRGSKDDVAMRLNADSRHRLSILDNNLINGPGPALPLDIGDGRVLCIEADRRLWTFALAQFCKFLVRRGAKFYARLLADRVD